VNSDPLVKSSKAPLVVGSLSGHAAKHLDVNEMASRCDIVELRWDLVYAEDDGWRESIGFWRRENLPLLLTARVPAEGGKCVIADEDLLWMAGRVGVGDYWDCELASWTDDRARRELLVRGWDEIVPRLVLSFHDFQATPSLDVLRALRDRAVAEKAHVFKVATFLQTEKNLDVLLELQREDAGIAVATMGMGQLGPESRVRCAVAGSVLNYGYLGSEPTAPGQWEAGALRGAILAAL
jgi:3-dehydroquinate dehydratase I